MNTEGEMGSKRGNVARGKESEGIVSISDWKEIHEAWLDKKIEES